MSSREERYIFVNASVNSNKGWVIRLKGTDVISYWGRIRSNTSFEDNELDGVQTKTWHFASENLANNHIDKKCREKEKKGYKKVSIAGVISSNATAIVNRGLKEIAFEQISHDCDKTKQLIERIVVANIHNIVDSTNIKYNSATGLFRTPIGVVDQKTVDDARNVLLSIGNCINASRKVPMSSVEEYLYLIPQDTGRVVKNIFSSYADIDKQINILDSLQSSIDVVTAIKPDDKEERKDKPKVFDCALEYVSFAGPTNPEWTHILDFYRSGINKVHASRDLAIKNVWRVKMPKITSRFNETVDKIGNVKRLWHGTRSGNLLSLLSKGFVVPPSNAGHVTGRMFGPGTYFSDQSTKSLNYSQGYWSGTRQNNCFMFLCDVALGKIHIPNGPTSQKPPIGYHSYFAKAGVSGVINNEFIVPNVEQANLCYLVEFDKEFQ